MLRIPITIGLFTGNTSQALLITGFCNTEFIVILKVDSEFNTNDALN